jgi:hypothetical protein
MEIAEFLGFQMSTDGVLVPFRPFRLVFWSRRYKTLFFFFVADAAQK